MNKSDLKVQADLDELIGELAEQYTQRLREGERPDVEEYAQRHPAAAEAIRQILPALGRFRAPGGHWRTATRLAKFTLFPAVAPVRYRGQELPSLVEPPLAGTCRVTDPEGAQPTVPAASVAS
jgi:hypothetical protein